MPTTYDPPPPLTVDETLAIIAANDDSIRRVRTRAQHGDRAYLTGYLLGGDQLAVETGDVTHIRVNLVVAHLAKASADEFGWWMAKAAAKASAA